MPARVTAIGLVVLLFTGCATIPTGPSVMVLPGTGKSFEQFQADDAVCRSWALQQTGTEPGTAATRDTLTGAAVGAVVGAGLGAAIGAAAGHPGAGAAIGAGGARDMRPAGETPPLRGSGGVRLTHPALPAPTSARTPSRTAPATP